MTEPNPHRLRRAQSLAWHHWSTGETAGERTPEGLWDTLSDAEQDRWLGRIEAIEKSDDAAGVISVSRFDVVSVDLDPSKQALVAEQWNDLLASFEHRRPPRLEPGN